MGGYESHLAVMCGGLIRAGRFKECWEGLLAMSALRGLSVLGAIGLTADLQSPRWMRRIGRRLTGRDTEKPPWLLTNQLEIGHPSLSLVGGERTVERESIEQVLRTSLPMQLHSVDRSSMAHSVESRSPFLDFRLVEMAIGLSDEFKVGRGSTKRILRAALEGILPEQIRLRRDKIGFATPEAEWLRDSYGFFENGVSKAIQRSDGLITSVALRKLSNMRAGREPYRGVVWRWISFGQWLEEFDVTPS
jgi:asparagine synthase (glutamine-hydrolysing)